MWTFAIKTGSLRDKDGNQVALGYSGFAEGKNNPAMQDHSNVGPIPVGEYTIGPPYDTESHGPFVMSLTPAPANEMYGRSGFLMHGDSIAHPGSASHGCIIMSRAVRTKVWESGDHTLQVISGEDTYAATDAIAA